MTTTPLTTDESDLAVEAAAAAAAVLPAPEELDVGMPLPATDQLASDFAGSVLVELEGSVSGRLAVLVGDELVTALSQSPIGGLDLAAAMQPTLDAAAGALQARAGVARAVDPALVVSDLGGAVVAVPLIGSGAVAVVLVPDQVLQAASRRSASPEPAPATLPSTETRYPAVGLPSHDRASLGGSAGSSVGQAPAGMRRGIELLHGVDMEVTVEIGRTRMTVRDLLDLSPGAVLELDRAAGSPADLLVNGRLIARGEVVVVDEDFGLRVTEIVTDTAGG